MICLCVLINWDKYVNVIWLHREEQTLCLTIIVTNFSHFKLDFLLILILLFFSISFSMFQTWSFSLYFAFLFPMFFFMFQTWCFFFFFSLSWPYYVSSICLALIWVSFTNPSYMTLPYGVLSGGKILQSFCTIKSTYMAMLSSAMNTN